MRVLHSDSTCCTRSLHRTRQSHILTKRDGCCVCTFLQLWDEELADVAQRHAEQCLFEHDCSECRKVGKFSSTISDCPSRDMMLYTALFINTLIHISSGRFPAGQNLAIEWTTGPQMASNWKKMITNWYEEVEEFPSTSARKYE